MKNFFKQSLRIFNIWRLKNISHQNFIYLLSILIGLVSGLGAVCVKNLTHYIAKLAKVNNYFDFGSMFYLYPVAGLLLTYWMKRYIIKRQFSHGIPSTLSAISQKKGVMPRYQMISSLLTSPLTVGFGGSAGLEAPAVTTGAAVGSNFASWLQLPTKDKILLISCGAAASISCVFNAPIAGLVFTIEIFRLELAFSSLIPLLISAVTANIVSYLFLEGGRILDINIEEAFVLGDIPWYLALAIFTAFIGLYFSKVYLWTDTKFESIKKQWVRILLGAALLSSMIYLIPPLYGEGFEIINSLMLGEYTNVVENNPFDFIKLDSSYIVILFLAGLIICKPWATAITFGAGGIGGIFTPVLFLGSVAGFFFAYTFNFIFDTHLSLMSFTLVGMAGVMSGVMQGPLTAIFIIAELTGGYILFIPLMLVSAVSYVVHKVFLTHSVYTYELAKKGQLISHNKDKTVLAMLQIEEVIENNFLPVDSEELLGDLLKNTVSKSKRNLFPVIENGKFIGIITMDDLREIMFEQTLYKKLKAVEIMKAPPALIDILNDRMEDVIQKFNVTDAWNLPVIKNGEYLGFISKSNLFQVYREKIIEVSHE